MVSSQALAHKRFSNGIVYGIDPWDSELARENDNKELKEPIDNFLDKTDLECIINKGNIKDLPFR